MAISRIDILNHALPRAFRGYSTVEVDRLLQDASDSLARLSDEKVALMNRVARLEAGLAEHLQREASMREALIATQRMSEDMRAQAQKEAQLILEAARTKAESLVNQGVMRLARLLEERAEARKLKARFEMKVRTVAEHHLKLLDMEKLEEEELAQEARRIAHNAAGPAR
jgi:cell division initiation protein